MAELTTIARPYAEAAFRLAQEGNALPVWSQMLRLVSSVIADPRIAAALDNPRLSAGDKESLLLSVVGEGLDPLGNYPQPTGVVALTLTPSKSKSLTEHWCHGGSYEGGVYAVPHPPPCETGIRHSVRTRPRRPQGSRPRGATRAPNASRPRH